MSNDVLFGKYKIISSLGKGGYSEVLLVRHIQLDCLRAIKIINKGNFLHDRLIIEASILKNLHHECIPTIFDIEEDDECSYIIEEYCKGVSLKKERGLWEESDISKIINYSLQICDLINYLHEGGHRILYLDLKPENILICEGKIMLVDFGTAIFANDTQDMKVSMGTRGYAAPEQYDNKLRPDERSDIYGIGCVIGFLKYGISGNEIVRRFSGIRMRDDLDNIISRCLMDNPAKRYQSVEELMKELRLINGSSYGKTGVKKGRKRRCHNVDVMEKLRDDNASENEKNHIEGIMVCVAGTHVGTGTTAWVYTLARYFGEYLKKRVVVLDLSDDDDFFNAFRNNEGIKGRYDVVVDNNKKALTTDNIVMRYYSEGYNVVIVDYGVMNPHKINSFIKGNLQFVATSICEWKLQKLIEFVDRYNSFDDKGKWNYLCKDAGNSIKKIEKLLCIRLSNINQVDCWRMEKKDVDIIEENIMKGTRRI